MRDINKHFSLARNIYIYIYILLAVALLLLILFPVYIKEDSASATTGTATSSTTSLTLTTNHTSANVTITPNSANGTFAMSSTAGEAQFGVTTNNFTGYELRIKADDDNGNLVNIDNGNTHTISSIPSSITKSSFDTTTYNNKWGYKPNKYVSSNTVIDNTGDSALFLPSPTTAGTMLDRTTTANSSANTYTIALGIRADHNTYAGTYSKTFTLVATANPITYTINYNKNTTDSVSNMPATSTTGSTTSTTINLPNTVPTRAHYSFLGWCNTTPTTSNGIDSCSGTTYQPGDTYGLDQTTANTTTLYAMWKIDTFVQTTQVRYEDENGAWGNYSTVHTQTLNYGSSYSWSTSQISGFNSSIYQAASVSSYTVTGAKTNQVSIYRNTYTCYIQSRDQKADGSYTGYTARVNTTMLAGNTCSWSSSANSTYKAASYSATITGNISQSLNIDRQVYTCYIQSRHQKAGGDYDNYTARVNTTMLAGNTCSWSSSADSTYKAASYSATITGNISQSLNIDRQTYYLTINRNTSYISSTSGAGYYRAGQTASISATASSGSEFTSWSQTAGTTGSFGNTASASTTFTMPTSNATVYANGKSSKLFFQNATSAQCGQIMYDNRGTDAYKNIAYTTASINGLCWMTRNLDLPGDTTLTPADSNVTSNYTLPASSASAFNSYYTAHVYNSGSTTCGNGSPCYSYYSYADATAGTGPSSGNATSDICPKGWRLPTRAEYIALKNTYTTGATLTASPFYAVYAGGYYLQSSFNYGGSNGYYWSSTAYSATGAYYLYFRSSNANTDYSNKVSGFSVRCVAK